MRKAVRAIIMHEDRLLVMHRNKFGREYDTLPGGNIEVGESPEEALFREVAEETTITIHMPRLVFIEEAGDPYGTQYIYLCKYISGEPHLAPDSEEMHINAMGKNLYDPRWLPLDHLPDAPFLSERLKLVLLDCIKNGFPHAPHTFSG